MPDDRIAVPGGHVLNLPKLDGTNYQSWIEMVNLALEIRGWKAAAGQDTPDARIGALAKMMILEAMNENHRAQVRGCETVKSILERLQLIYADKSAANLYRLLHQFYRYTKKQEDSMSQHVGKMDDMRAQLADLGEKQSEAVYQVSLIASLPSEYTSIMEIWELTHKDMRTTQNLISRLLKREDDLKRRGINQLLLVKNPRTSEPTLTPEEKMKRITCYNCQELGHYARDCKKEPKLRKKNERDRLQRDGTSLISRSEINFNVTDAGLNLRDKWVCDSGATSHMCNNQEWFDELHPSKNGKCYIGDGQSLEVRGSGSVSVESFVDGVWKRMRLNNVLLVPDLATNLISVGEAGESGVVTTFSKDSCLMQQGKVQVAVGLRLKDRLYLMNIKASGQTTQALAVTSRKPLEHYHRVLGHAGKDRVVQVLKDLDIPFDTEETVNCEECPGGRGRHSQHPSVDRVAPSPGTIHVDLSGIVNIEALQGYKYYMLCKDEFSEFTMVYFCKEKHEVPRLLAQMLIDFETLSKTAVREIHSDNGSEFVNKVTKLLFLKERVKHWTSAPFCAQQNGRIEREMQTVTNMARTMLNASNLPKSLWAQATESAVHIKNRLPTSKSKKTPIERLTGVKPTIDHLVEFGTPVHLLVNDKYLTKWDCRTIEGFVVGFTQRRNTYSVYIPSKGKITQSCDVIFAGHATSIVERTKQQPHSDETASPVSFGEYVTGEFISTPEREEATEQEGEHESGINWQTRKTSTPRSKGRTNMTGDNLTKFFSQYHKLMEDATEAEEPIYENIENQQHDQSICTPPVPLQHDECNSTYCHSIEKPERYSDDITIPTMSELSGNVAGLPEKPEPIGNNQGILLTVNHIDNFGTPSSYQQAIESDDCDAWKGAIKAELKAHETNDTWSEVERPPSVKILTVKWIFSVKRDTNGNVVRYKARLVARGFEQQYGVDYNHTFAPVARLESIRTLFALSAAQQMDYAQFDVSTAFLNGTLEEEVYIEAPAGVNTTPNHCLKLNKALYGLKQSPRAWNSTFDETMRTLKFEPTLSDTCVYTNREKTIHLAIYVDDGIVFGPSKERCLQVIGSLEQQFKLKRLDGSLFLGMEINRSGGKIHLSQRRYIADLIERFNLMEAKTVSSPIIDIANLTNTESVGTTAPYRAAIGSLQYLATATRPDILFTVSLLSQFNHAPTEIHWQAVKRVIRYLKGTPDYALSYEPGSLEVEAYSDADWANDRDFRRSTSGLLIKLGGGPIIFASRKQSSIAQSSTEAEYIAANEATKEIKWLTQFTTELGVMNLKATLIIDNCSTIKQIESNETKRRSKHIELRYHYIRQQYQQKLFELKPVPSEDQLADFLTKPINGPRLVHLLAKSNMVHKRRENPKQFMGLVALTLIACMGLVSLTDGQETVRLTSTNIFIRSAYTVAEGINTLRMDIQFPDICRNHSSQPRDSVYNVQEESSEILTRLCIEAFENMKDTIQKLGTCLPESGWSKLVTRVKRFFDPVTVILTLVVVAVVYATLTVVEYIDPESDKNHLKQVTQENKMQNHQIGQLMDVARSSMKSSDDLYKLLKPTSERAENNERALKQAAAIHTHTAWRSTNIGIRLHELTDGLTELHSACSHERLSINGLKKIASIPELDGTKDEDAVLKGIRASNENTLSIQAWINVINPNVIIAEVIGLSHWANYTTKPVWVNYHGPQYVIYNATNNCMRAVQKPSGRISYERCDFENYKDPDLDDYRPESRSHEEAKAGAKPVVHDLGDDNLVYCLYQQVTIGTITSPCPPMPFLVPKGVSFKVGNITYIAKSANLVKTGAMAYTENLRLTNISSPEFLLNAQMYQTIEAHQSARNQLFTFDGERLTITRPPASMLMTILSYAMSSMGGIATVLTIFLFIMSCIRPNGTGGGGDVHSEERESHTENITIINEAHDSNPVETGGEKDQSELQTFLGRSGYPELSHSRGVRFANLPARPIPPPPSAPGVSLPVCQA